MRTAPLFEQSAMTASRASRFAWMSEMTAVRGHVNGRFPGACTRCGRERVSPSPFASVPNLDEEEPLGGSGRAGGATVAGAQDVTAGLDRHLSGTDEKECSDDGPDHVVQEAIGFDVHDYIVAPPLDIKRMH